MAELTEKRMNEILTPEAIEIFKFNESQVEEIQILLKLAFCECETIMRQENLKELSSDLYILRGKKYE